MLSIKIICSIGVFSALMCAAESAQEWISLAQEYNGRRRFDDELRCYQKAAQTYTCSDLAQERTPAMLMQRAQTYLAVGDVDNALIAYRALLKTHSHSAAVWYNCGYTYKMAEREDEALAAYDKAVEVDPTYESAYFARARTYLQKGDFVRGWQEYERHLKQVGQNAEQLREMLRTNTLQGKTILMVPEGSLGDVIQFIRFGKIFKDKGARVVAMVHKPLLQLLSASDCIDQLVTTKDALPYHHARVTMMNAPAILQCSEQEIPREQYVHADPVLVKEWQTKLSEDTNVKVGLCWQADIANDVSRLPVARRGIPLKLLAALAAVPGVSFYSLQKEDGVEQLNEVAKVMKITSFGDDFDGLHGRFMDTAAVMKNLDVVITVDTATAHLAGALHVSTWLMLPYSVDWRWITHRTDSPWYPTMRIFKQPKPFDWESVVAEIKLALAQKMKSS